MDDREFTDGLVRRGAELRERSAQVRAEAARIMARSAELVDRAADMQEAVSRRLQLLGEQQRRGAAARSAGTVGGPCAVPSRPHPLPFRAGLGLPGKRGWRWRPAACGRPGRSTLHG